MPNSGIMVGGAAGLYRNTAAAGNPTWLEVLLAKDVKPSGGWEFVEAPARDSPLKPYAKTQLDGPVQVMMRADILDAEYQAWVTAARSRIAALDLLILNAKRTVIGAVGWRGPYLVSISDEAQDIGGVIYTTFEMRPTIDDDGEYVVFAAVIAGAGGAATLDYTYPSWIA